MSSYRAKVEEIKTTLKGGKSIKFSGGFTGNGLFTGTDKDKNPVPFPEEVKVGAEVDFDVFVVGQGTDKEWNALSFPAYNKAAAPQQQGGKSSWQGGRQEDVELKLVSFAMSYAKDLFASTPEASLQGMYDTADGIFDHMLKMYKEAKK